MFSSRRRNTGDLGQKGWVSLMHAPQRRKADKAVKGGSHPAYSRDLQELKGLFNRKLSSFGGNYLQYRYQFTGISMKHWNCGIFLYCILVEISRGFFFKDQESNPIFLSHCILWLTFFIRQFAQISPRIMKDV